MTRESWKHKCDNPKTRNPSLVSRQVLSIAVCHSFDCNTAWSASLLLIAVRYELLVQDSLLDGHLGLSLLLALVLVVGAQVAIFANALSVQGSVRVGALGCLLCAALGVVAVLAHAVSIVLLAGVGALSDLVLMDARLFLAFIPRTRVVRCFVGCQLVV